jgi:hypothetical protein
VRALDPMMLSSAAQVITEAIRSDESVSDKVVELLIASGRRPANSDEAAASIARFAAVVESLLEIALTEAIEEDDEHLAEIRRFFLQPQETYSMKELAALWRVSLDDVRDVYHDEIAQWEISNGREGVETNKVQRIKWAKAVGTTGVFSLLRPFDIERALGPDFINVRTERWRTVPILIHLPRFVANAFELDASIPPRLALANRIEKVLLELFTTENLIGSEANEVRQQ